jgi:hypothetical protein
MPHGVRILNLTEFDGSPVTVDVLGKPSIANEVPLFLITAADGSTIAPDNISIATVPDGIKRVEILSESVYDPQTDSTLPMYYAKYHIDGTVILLH